MSPRLLQALGGRDAACRNLCRVRLKLAADDTDRPYAGIALWRGEQHWVERTVRPAYTERYVDISAELVDETGGNISLPTLLKIAESMARCADGDTGQDSRKSVETIMADTGLGERTVQRGRSCLRKLGVATEVLRGRQRTRDERMGSWRVGDKARGWASVYALHPARPVDKTRVVVAGQTVPAPHPTRGHFKGTKVSNKRAYYATRCGKKALRAASKREDSGRAVTLPPQSGAILASRWLADPRTPTWAGRHPGATWATVLDQAARHGWTAADLNDWLDEQTARLGELRPTNPAGWMRSQLDRADLAFPPHVLAAADRERDLRDREARRVQAAADAVEREHGRAAGIAALGGDGRRAALAQAQLAADRAADRTVPLRSAELPPETVVRYARRRR